MKDFEKAAIKEAEREYPRSFLYNRPKEIYVLKKIIKKAEEKGLIESENKETGSIPNSYYKPDKKP